MKYLKRKKRMPVPVVILLDLLLVGVILVVFAFFHHVLPAIISQQERQSALQTEPQTQTVPTTVPEELPETSEPETVETTTEPDNRTQWQIKFAEHFTDEIVVTDCSYTSPEVSITIDTVVTGEGSGKITYYVADIYIASIENFTAYTANGEMRYFGTQNSEEMAADANAILAISGDFLTYQKGGFLLRNGEVYTQEHNLNSICVLYPDGSMETLVGGTYQIDEILEKDPLQVWSFGPVLLDENGQVRDKYEVSTSVSYPNPRSAIGYYEPGHYCFVVVDGRQEGHSAGMKIPELAQVFADLGCTAAYNLDGGGTAVMLFEQEIFSRQSNGGRDLGDMLVITESGYRKTGEDAE